MGRNYTLAPVRAQFVAPSHEGALLSILIMRKTRGNQLTLSKLLWGLGEVKPRRGMLSAGDYWSTGQFLNLAHKLQISGV
jgi:hypothetical protein